MRFRQTSIIYVIKNVSSLLKKLFKTNKIRQPFLGSNKKELEQNKNFTTLFYRNVQIKITLLCKVKINCNVELL